MAIGKDTKGQGGRVSHAVVEGHGELKTSRVGVQTVRLDRVQLSSTFSSAIAMSGASPSPPDSSLDEATEEGFILVRKAADRK